MPGKRPRIARNGRNRFEPTGSMSKWPNIPATLTWWATDEVSQDLECISKFMCSDIMVCLYFFFLEGMWQMSEVSDCMVAWSRSDASKNWEHKTVIGQPATTTASPVLILKIGNRRTGLSAIFVIQCRSCLSAPSVVSKLLCMYLTKNKSYQKKILHFNLLPNP